MPACNGTMAKVRRVIREAGPRGIGRSDLVVAVYGNAEPEWAEGCIFVHVHRLRRVHGVPIKGRKVYTLSEGNHGTNHAQD